MLISQNRYTCHQGVMWRIKGIYISFRGGLIWFKVWLKRLKGLKLGVKLLFFIRTKSFIFWKICFEKNHVIQSYTWWMYLDLNINLDHFNMQNYPVIWEWSQANWLDPFILRKITLKIYWLKTSKNWFLQCIKNSAKWKKMKSILLL